MNDNGALLLANQVSCDIDDWENFKPLKRPRKVSKSSMTSPAKKLPKNALTGDAAKTTSVRRAKKSRRNTRKLTSRRSALASTTVKVDELITASSDKTKSSEVDKVLATEAKLLGQKNVPPVGNTMVGVCPSCQIPFSLLLIQSSNWHMTECFQLDRSKLVECPQGMECDSMMASHYTRYNHYELAHWRATGKVLKQLAPTNNFEASCLPSSVNQTEAVGKTVSIDVVKKVSLSEDTSSLPGNDEVYKFQDSSCGSFTSSKCYEKPREMSFMSPRGGSVRSPLRTSPKKRKGAVFSPTEAQKDIRSFFSSPEKIKSSSIESCSAVLPPCDDLKAPMKTASPRQEWSVRWWEKKRPSAGMTEALSTPDKASQRQRKSWGMMDFPQAEDDDAAGKTSTRQCPFYKKIPGTAFAVDAFSYGVIPGISAYFLSHFHADHYQGLKRRFSLPLYCNKITANLVQLQIKVDKKYINILPLNVPVHVQNVQVTLLEANHCPGAVMFLFTLPSGRVYLHTGDFRAHEVMEKYPALLQTSVDVLYLDTTYCNPRYDFAPQEDTVSFAVSLARDYVRQDPKTLVVCGAYTIGKEKIFLGIAKELGTKVHVLPPKLRILNCLEDPNISALVTSKETEAAVHVLPMMKLTFQVLEPYLNQFSGRFTRILAIKPTGWEHRGGANKPLSDLKPRKSTSGLVSIYGIPYSEHSSYYEMQRFVQFVRPKSILPTVNVGKPQERVKMQAIFSSWLDSSS